MSSQQPQPDERAALQALLHQQAAEIARRLNFLSSISVLNSDVLLKIFQLLCPVPALPQTGKKPRAKPPTTDIRHVSQVCHEWRQVALESPSLWAALDCNQEPEDWLLELIRRSKASPVNIFLDLTQGDSKLLAIAAKLAVVGSITLFDAWRSELDTVFNILDKSLQNGSVVNIKGRLLFSGPSMSRLPPLAIKPRALDLRGPVTDLTHPCFAQLQKLSMVNPHTTFRSSEWVRILRGFPQLIHLRLDWAIDDRGVAVAEPSPTPFSLPQLQSLILSSHDLRSGAGKLLSCFAPSQPYTLKLYCAVAPLSEDTDPLLQGIEKWSSAWLQGVSSPDINQKIHIISSYRQLSICNVDMPNNYSFDIKLKWPGGVQARELSKVEAKVLKVMQPVLRHALELRITPDWKEECVCPSTFWVAFPSVRTLSICNHHEAEGNEGFSLFLDALINDLARSPDVPLPNVKCLSLKRLNNMGENLVARKLDTLISQGRGNGWRLDELQIRQSSTTIGENLKRKYGRLPTVSVFLT